MVSGVPHDKGQIIQAIHKKLGVITHAARSMSIDPRVIYDWMERDPDVAKAVVEAREQNRKERLDADEAILNSAYDSIIALIRGRDVTATIFALKSKAKWSDKAGDELESMQPKIAIVDYSKAVNG